MNAKTPYDPAADGWTDFVWHEDGFPAKPLIAGRM